MPNKTLDDQVRNFTQHYCVRLNYHEGYLEKVQEEFTTTDYSFVLAVEHHGREGSNKHYHLVLTTFRKPQAFRVRLKTLFTKAKGNAHLSIKSWDESDNALSYLFHEDTKDHTTPIIVNSNLSDTAIAGLKNKNIKVKEKIGDNSPSAVCTKIYNDFVKSRSTLPDHRDIAYAIYTYYYDVGSWQPNKYQVERYIKHIQSLLSKYFDQASGRTDDVEKEKLLFTWYYDMFPQRHF